MVKQIDLEDLAREMSEEGKRTATYIRVSTASQNTGRQVVEGSISYVDVCSGSVEFSKRKQASRLLTDIKEGKFEQVQVHSIDRLGRNTVDILNTIQLLTDKGINVISAKEGLETIINGKENPIAKMIIGILGTLAEFELNRIKERTQEGIEKAKERGIYKGRNIGSKESNEVFFNKAKVKTIVIHLKRGESLKRTALLSKASLNLTRKVRDKLAELE